MLEKLSGRKFSKGNVFEAVWIVVAKIPKGKVLTYGKIAGLLLERGIKIDARTVGWALHANKFSKVPCHRVVNKDGRLAKSFGFGGEEEQRKRLEAEGIGFIDKNHVDLKRYCLE